MEHAKDTMEMEPNFMTLGDAAEGAIQAGPEQQERLESFTTRIAAGEFHGEAQALVPVICIDGRFGGFHMLPNAAGGSETVFVADDLTNKLYGGEDGTTLSGYANVLDRIVEKGELVGGHDDDHHDEAGSGCGANDKLPDIYKFLGGKGDAIREVAAKLGVNVSDTLHDKIVSNAKSRNSFSHGAQMLSVLEDHDEEVIVEHLGGAHKEVVAVINTKEGTTLNRQDILDEFGEDYEAFNVDVWAFQNAAELLTDDVEQQQELVTAMVYYNLATAHVLCGPGMRVVTL